MSDTQFWVTVGIWNLIVFSLYDMINYVPLMDMIEFQSLHYYF